MVDFEVLNVEPARARELIDQGWYVLDVRTDAEWAEGHIAGSNHVPMDQVVQGIGSREIEPVLVVCAAGGRSWRVAQYLALQGVETANLDGGLFAWEAAGLPVER